MTDEEAVFRGQDAKRLLDDPILRDAFKAVSDSLENAALKCDRTDVEAARAICISKQLLVGIQREIHRFIETGKIADDLIEKRKKPLLRVFSR